MSSINGHVVFVLFLQKIQSIISIKFYKIVGVDFYAQSFNMDVLLSKFFLSLLICFCLSYSEANSQSNCQSLALRKQNSL